MVVALSRMPSVQSNPPRTVALYTCCFGSYTGLKEVACRFDGCDYICFTDNPDLISKTWEVRVVECDVSSPISASRHPKILPHLYMPEYSATLYVDANISVRVDPSLLADKYLDKAPFWVPKHPERKCLFAEAVECAVLRRGTKNALREEVARYALAGTPKDFGLSENGVLLRAHNDDEVIKIMELWWLLFSKGSLRDQISLPVAIWKSSKHFNYLDESVRDSGREFTLNPHEKTSTQSFLDRLLKKFDIILRRIYFRFFGL